MKTASLLLVDDERTNLMVLANALEDDYLLFMAKSGEDAIRIARDNPIDLVLLDVMMPDMNGYETLARLREYPETQHLPVIFVTALTDRAAERKGIGLGAVDFITKPFDMPILKLRVANQVELVGYRKTLEHRVAERTAEVVALREAAERESRAKTTLIRNLHDCLKNPLSAIIGFSQLLQQDAQPEEISEFSGQILGNAELIASLLNPMLKYADLENETIRNEHQTIALPGLLAEIVDLKAFTAQQRGVTVRVMPIAPGAVSVFGSYEYLRTALVELVRNAILYSPTGATVTLSAVKTDAGVRLEVRDQGPGIPADQVPAALMPFNRLGKPLGKDGLGLGLAVVQRILDALSIEFGLENEAEGGLCVWMICPASASA